jgi:hypothetical protein
VRGIDRGSDARSIAMLGGDRFSEARIFSAHFELERAPTHGEGFLQDLQPPFLIRIERQLVMENCMKFGVGLRRGLDELPPNNHANDGGEKGEDRYERQAPRVHRVPARSVDGASGLGAPNGDNVVAA